jgi:hypothetical protein
MSIVVRPLASDRTAQDPAGDELAVVSTVITSHRVRLAHRQHPEAIQPRSASASPVPPLIARGLPAASSLGCGWGASKYPVTTKLRLHHL